MHDHLWLAAVSDRVHHGSGCPVCSGNQPCSPSCGSLLAVHPDVVAAEWDEQANLSLTPGQLLPQSNRPVRWRCRHDPQHMWMAAPSMRFGTRQSGCPACANARRSRLAKTG